jgi:CheY-like chemotaxis protein
MAREILIADSDKADQEGFKRIFEETDYRLIFSENGEDALQQIKFFKPDLIIADTALSEKTGIQLCSTIKNDREFKDIPFILLRGIFEEMSEKDLDRIRANGVISKPLQEGEIMNLVDRLMEERAMQKKKGESLLNGFENPEDEEIIELVDVVEEPESRMSINDFLAPEKGELPGKVSTVATWEKGVEKEEKAFEEELMLSLEEEGREEEERRETRVEPIATPTGEREAPEEKGFDKVALEEILQRMEKIRPSVENEFFEEGGAAAREPEGIPSPSGEAAEKPFSLEDFEAALRREAAGGPSEGALESLFEEAPPTEVAGTTAPPETMPEEERPSPEPMEEDFQALLRRVSEEEPAPEVSPTPPVAEEELTAEALEEALGPVTKTVSEKKPGVELPSTEELLEEEAVEELVEEEFPLEAFPREELKEEEFPKALLEGEPLGEEVFPSEVVEAPQVETAEAPEVPPFFEEELQVAEAAEGVEEVEEGPRAPAEQVIPPVQVASLAGMPERRMEEAIARGIQTMMEDFLTKVVPEMTQNMINLTMERIEQMVREIVPGIAEKAIQEEIKRLQEEEKD